jgi:DNA-directed RNA polymerase specialized sigma24 family protein
VRRYRAERLLRQEFQGLRARVIATVRGRLRASGVSLDQCDLEACYAAAWQGLYAVVLDGQEIANPTGWLTLVTFRRAIEEHRSRKSVVGFAEDRREHAGGPAVGDASQSDGAHDHDYAAELDDRMRLRQLFEGLRGRLSAREREAATLCYLQGLSRAEAATRMGVSQARMRKLMEGQGVGRPGVASKVGALVETIRDGGWCQAQGSLMRGLAYGVLDPEGERYQLALMHLDDCPACGAYVRSLRGLAAALPPVLLPWGVGAAALAGGGVAGTGVGGALSASGAAGAGGAAGGSWLLAGGTFAGKLAVGCVLALGVGAGCLALSDGVDHARAVHHGRRSAHVTRADHGALATSVGYQLSASALGQQRPVGTVASAGATTGALTPAGRASREFGPEQALAPGGARSVAVAGAAAAAGDQASAAHAASSGSGSAGTASSAAGGSAAGEVAASDGGGSQSARRVSAEDASKAEREFAPG